MVSQSRSIVSSVGTPSTEIDSAPSNCTLLNSCMVAQPVIRVNLNTWPIYAIKSVLQIVIGPFQEIDPIVWYDSQPDKELSQL
jgi:hypothetical protein